MSGSRRVWTVGIGVIAGLAATASLASCTSAPIPAAPPQGSADASSGGVTTTAVSVGDRVAGAVWVGFPDSLPRQVCWEANGPEVPLDARAAQCDVTLDIVSVAVDLPAPPVGRFPYALVEVEADYLSGGELGNAILSPARVVPPADDSAMPCTAGSASVTPSTVTDVEQSAVLSELDSRDDLITQYRFIGPEPGTSILQVSSVMDPAEVAAALVPLWPNVCVTSAVGTRAEQTGLAQQLETPAATNGWRVRSDFDGGVTVSMAIVTAADSELLSSFTTELLRVEPALTVRR